MDLKKEEKREKDLDKKKTPKKPLFKEGYPRGCLSGLCHHALGTGRCRDQGTHHQVAG